MFLVILVLNRICKFGKIEGVSYNSHVQCATSVIGRGPSQRETQCIRRALDFFLNVIGRADDSLDPSFCIFLGYVHCSSEKSQEKASIIQC